MHACCFFLASRLTTARLDTIADTSHGPVNRMSSFGWTGSTLSNQLGSANPRQVGLTNHGWLPAGPTGGPISSQNPPPMRVSLESHAQISAEFSELLSKGAITETRVSTDQFVSQLFLVEIKGWGGRDW